MRPMYLRVAMLVVLLGCRELPEARPDGTTGDAAPGSDAARDAAIIIDGGLVDDGDGTPVRLPCTGAFTSGLATSGFGRLDGILVAVVPPTGNRACRADSDHLHLQVQAGGGIYDVAINIGSDVHTQTIDRAAFSAWSEGWHTTGDGTSGNVFIDYPGLGLHAATMPLSTPVALVNAMLDDLATVNHISIYATAYS